MGGDPGGDQPSAAGLGVAGNAVAQAASERRAAGLTGAPAAQKLESLERLAALAPADAELQRQLIAALREAGKAEAAAQLERRLGGESPNHFGLCTLVNGRPQVVLAATDNGAPLVGVTSEPLAAIAPGFGGLRWLKLKGGDAEDVAGTPFPSPSLEQGLLGADFIRLGNCTRAELGWSYASGPVNRSHPVPEEQQRLQALDTALKEIGMRGARLAWTRRAYGGNTLRGIAEYRNPSSGSAGVIVVTLPPAPAEPALHLVPLVAPTRAAPEEPLYLAGGVDSQIAVLAKVTARGGLEPVTAEFPGDDYECPATEVDTSGFAPERLARWEAFQAQTRELEKLASTPRRWQLLGGPAATGPLGPGSIDCTWFPELRRRVALGPWSRPDSKPKLHVAYASAPLKRLPAVRLTAELKKLAPTARGDQTWAEAADQTRFGLLPFDEVTCESHGDDSTCGGDRDFYVVRIPKGGKPEVLKVVIDTTGC